MAQRNCANPPTPLALTGLTRPTDGDAFVQGKSIRTSMSAVQKSMGIGFGTRNPILTRNAGVCPQYDILWAQMTAREHLELFAGLKQVPAEAVAQEVIDRLKDVDLIDDADNLAGNHTLFGRFALTFCREFQRRNAETIICGDRVDRQSRDCLPGRADGR